MEQIARLLFATTVITIFAYVLIYTSVGLAGNGGEYWGYDGYEDARDAAYNSFSTGDYRYLEIDLTDSNGNITRGIPVYSRCYNHPLGIKPVTRKSADKPIHGYDSIRLATDFAERFNNAMNYLLESELNVCCGDCRQR